jgi:DNA processing protein
VLAGGLSRIYPPEHKELADQVSSQGALITESCMDQEPLAGLFPARNRIISGLSHLVVIVQADAVSGSLITASHAGDQGRTVMAVPGPIDNDLHAGCHALLRQGAVLCRNVEDILEELDGVSAVVTQTANPPADPQSSRHTPCAVPRTSASLPPSPPLARTGPPPGLDETQMRVWQLLEGGSRAVDEIAQQLGLDVPKLSTVLLLLEMKNVVRRLPGNRYERR